MFELAESIRLSVDADLVNLYLVETDGEITKYSPDGDSRYKIIVWQCQLWLIQHLPSWRGHHHRSIHGPLQNCHQSVSTNWRLQVSSWCSWSEGVYHHCHHCHHQCYHHHHQDLVGKVLCHPICSQDEELEAIIELIRTSGNMFTDDDCEVGLIDGFCIQNILFIFCAKIFRLSTVIWSGEALLFTMLMRSVTVNRRNINVTFFPP